MNTFSNARDGLPVKLDYLNCWGSWEDELTLDQGLWFGINNQQVLV